MREWLDNPSILTLIRCGGSQFAHFDEVAWINSMYLREGFFIWSEVSRRNAKRRNCTRMLTDGTSAYLLCTAFVLLFPWFNVYASTWHVFFWSLLDPAQRQCPMTQIWGALWSNFILTAQYSLLVHDIQGSGVMSGTAMNLDFFSKIGLWRCKSVKGKIS